MTKLVQINDSRYPHLEDQFSKDYFQHIIHFLKSEKAAWKSIYPPGWQIFNAFEYCHWDEVKVVILGQDPYHGYGQAHGMCFGVPEWITPPPSLQNIFKEIRSEYPEINWQKKDGDLTDRANQGVLLLNSFLTVEAGKPLSHSKIGWEVFTDHIISLLSTQKVGIVFMLWWGFAKSKAALIDSSKHLILKASHPSPLSANQWWWFWSKHFGLCNEYLEKQQKKTIVWTV